MLPVVLLSLSSCAYFRGAWRTIGSYDDPYVIMMVYGESLTPYVEDGFPIQLLTSVDKNGSRPSSGGYALVGYLGRYTGDSEPVNLTGREPIGGFPELRGGGVWLRYWTNEEFHIPEREVDGIFLRPKIFKHEETIVIPRFLLDEGKEEENSICLILAHISVSSNDKRTITYFYQESAVTIDFRWIGEDEIEILPD